MPSITEDILLAAGYTKHKPSALSHEHAEAHYQKRIADDRGVRYFIDIYHYIHQHGDRAFEGWQPEVQFRLERGEDVDIFCNHTLLLDITSTLEFVEQHFSKVFECLNCAYKKTWDE